MTILLADKIEPLHRMVLLRSNTSALQQGSIVLPSLSRYPDQGWIKAVGPQVDPSLAVGQYVLLESENEPYEGVPIDYFQVLVEAAHEGLVPLALPVEEEPRLRELVSLVRADSDADRRIQLADVFTDETWTLMISDIKDFQLGKMPVPGWGLEYVHTFMFWTVEGDLMYLVEDQHIQAIIHLE
jgi:hypothetical protein